MKSKIIRLKSPEKWKRSTKTDLIFLIYVIAISIFGTVCVFSAGQAYAYARYNDQYYFIKKQLIWLAIGFVAMYAGSRVNWKYLKNLSPHFYIFTLLLLVLVLVIGFVGNGAKRWISIGPLTIQPSEIAKLTMIMMLAYYFDVYEKMATMQKKDLKTFVYGTFYPCIIMIVPIILVMLQHHLSCIIILGLIGLLVILSAGINPRYISLFCAIGVVAVTFLALFTDYTKDRITAWQNPEAYKLTGGWQTLQGLMAIGSGGLFGVGFGNSILKHCYVSEPANDMIFSILCEELGFVGALTVFILFGLLVTRGFFIALKATNTYARILVIGICIKTSVQVLLNVAVVTNTIPNTGISLPFFSYGGSSLVMLFFEMGIILSISKETKIGK